MSSCLNWRNDRASVDGRIVGGVDAKPNMEPWVASLR